MSVERAKEASAESATGDAASSLERLAREHGLQPSYADVWGGTHQVSQASLELLLAGLGVQAGRSGKAEDSLDRRTTTADKIALPPVVVVEAVTTPWDVTFEFGGATEALSWTLAMENGTRTAISASTLSGGAIEEPSPPVSATTNRRASFDLPLAPGYHRLSCSGLHGDALVVSAPRSAFGIDQAGARRVWGPAVQLYALRSDRNWGIGDFADLRLLAQEWSALGCGVIGLNPLHALFGRAPEHASPYSPSSRLWLNPLYLAVDEIDDFHECEAAVRLVQSPDFQERLRALRSSCLVNYQGVADAKLEVLELLHRSFRKEHLAHDTERCQQFKAFQHLGGRALRRHAIFEALDRHFETTEPDAFGWLGWPTAYHDPSSSVVAAFVVQHPLEVEFHEYLQWQAALQLGAVRSCCVELGMPLGLYLDLAVSVDPHGSDTWSQADLFVSSAGVGAPPDEFNPKGQTWGLAPLHPRRLRATQHRFFIDTVSRIMANAGAIRIDHVMGLMRLFLVPQGTEASEGAYLHYPFDELLAIIRLESQRHRTVVVGEDLGTVDPAVRTSLSQSGVLSYKLVYFERKHGGDFKPAHEYAAQALAAISTHDLATFAGWWTGRDLTVRSALQLFPSDEIRQAQTAERDVDRVRLLELLSHAGLLTDEDAARLQPLGQALPSPALLEAVHVLLAGTPAQITMVQLEDVAGAVEQSNMPATTTEHPNWRRKLPAADLATSPDVRRLLHAVHAARSI